MEERREKEREEREQVKVDIQRGPPLWTYFLDFLSLSMNYNVSDRVYYAGHITFNVLIHILHLWKKLVTSAHSKYGNKNKQQEGEV